VAEPRGRAAADPILRDLPTRGPLERDLDTPEPAPLRTDPPLAAGAPASGTREPLRNPFLLAVAALGVLCLLAGGIWIGRTRDFFDIGAQNEADFWLVMISLVGAPLLLTLGLAIVAGVLFFLARHWQRQAN
jgi:hypothetical protein